MISDKQILAQAKRRYKECEDHWSDHHRKTTELFQFTFGEQWTYAARQSYENAGFAAMTSNRLPTFLRQITNELLKNTPEGQVDPRDDGDEKKAEVVGDLIRAIQEDSKAKVSYAKAAEHAAISALGYWRVLSKFKDLKSFDKILCIESIQDPNTVMLDPNHKGLCGEDSEFAFISAAISQDEYRQKYSKTKLRRMMDGAETEEDIKDVSWHAAFKQWNSNKQVIILEYYFKDYQKKSLYELQSVESGEVFIRDFLPKEEIQAGLVQLIDERTIDEPIIRWVKMNDIEILESTEWPGEFIPVVAVKADEAWIEGKRKLMGAIEPAIEAQVELNYAKSWRAKLLQMAPTAPMVGTAEQFAGFEQDWANANVSNVAFLKYNHVEGVNPPSRDGSEAPIQSASVLVQGAEQDLQKIFGVFDPDHQQQGPESGKAILARQSQSYNSNYHFYENLARSIEHTICILVQAIPVVYDNSRTEQILAEDGKKRTVSLNTPNEQGVLEYDLTVGEYTVSIQSGPSFGTKRQETAEAGMTLMEVYPAAAPAIADLIVRSMDWPGAQQMADSMEAMVPPQVLAARKTDPSQAAAMVPKLQAQLQAAQTQIQEISAHLTEATAKLNDKSTDLQIEVMKSKDDEHKVNSDSQVKMAQLALEEKKITAELMIREQELRLAIEELNLEREKLSLGAVKVQSEIIDKHHDRTIAELDRVQETPEDTVGAEGALE